MGKSYFLGVDVGGTKTHAILADERGQVLGFGQAGCGNHEAVGYDGLERALRQSTEQALRTAGIKISQIAGAGFGVAGYDWPCERQDTLDTIARLGLDCPVEAVNDTIVGLIAGTSQGWGLVIDAGTGNNVRGRDPGGREVQVTGCGDAFGEYGGAGDVVYRALQMVSYEWYRRGPKTALTPVFIHYTGASGLFDLIQGLSQGYYTLDGDAAPLVFSVAAEGDPVAKESIRWVASELGETACGVIRELGFEQLEFEVVLIGSLFNGGSLFLEPLKQIIWNTAPQARFVRLKASPAVGGVLLAMDAAGQCGREVRERLLQNLPEKS